MYRIRNNILIAVCFMGVIFCQCMGVSYAAELAAALPYTQTFSENTDGLTDSTGEVITEEDGNKALKLTQSQTAAFHFARTTESGVVVSYKLKVVNLVAQGGASDFGTVKLGSDPAVQVVRYQGHLIAYNYSTDHSSSDSNNGVDLSLYADGNYHTVSYNIDFQAGIYAYNIDGKQITNVRNLRTTGIKSVDTLYFAMKNNAEILYVDDISVKEIVPSPVSYVQSFDDAETVTDVTGLTVGRGDSSSIITEADGNKVLKVTGADMLTFAPEGRTTTNLVEISYKIKIGTVNESVKYKDFGTALSGTAKAVEVFRFQKNLLAYNNSTSHATNSNSNVAICTLTANQDDTYHAVTYYINFSAGTYSTYFDGVLAGNSVRSLRTDGTTSIDSLYFDVQTGEEYYIDDVTIKDASLELRSTTPANGSTNDKMSTAVTMTFTSRIASAFAAKDYFKFYENGKLLSDYTITQSSDNTVNLTPANGFYGNCTYTVEIDKAVNAETDGYASLEENILLSFKTEGFLVSSYDDEDYGGHVMTNGKTYTFRTGYTNQSETVETPF